MLDLENTVKPVLSDHPSVHAKVVAQNRWSLNGGSLTRTNRIKRPKDSNYLVLQLVNKRLGYGRKY